MKQACIFNIQRYSLHDGGGIRSIVFFKGCPFTCPWCCNPESLDAKPQLFYKEILCMNCSKKINGLCETSPDDCPTGAKEIVGKMQTVEEVYDIINRDRTFYESSNGGVTLSGGEFLMQIDFAIDLLKKCKEEHLHTAVETTLALPIPRIKELAAYVDVFLVDFKIMDQSLSLDILHLDVERMKENVKLIIQMGGHVIPRIPLIPEYTVNEMNLHALIQIIQDLHLHEVHLLPFHQLGEGKYKSIQKDYACKDVTPLSDEIVQDIERLFNQHGLKTIVHGT